MTTDFYSLNPVGVATADVESLTGYIARLAAEHLVYVTDLLYKPLQDGNPLWPKARQITHTRMGVNGRSESTVQFVRALERRTGVTGLAMLTCVPIREAVAETGLFKPRQYWCPVCYEQWAVAGDTVYEPLYWTLSTTRTCFHHHRPLENRCPTCGRQFSPLLKLHAPGHCGHCGAWLGASGSDGTQSSSQDIRDTSDTRRLLERWAHLHRNPSLKEQLRANLGDLDRRIGLSRLMTAIGLRGDKVNVWANGTVLPTLPAVLHRSHALDIAVDDLLFGHVDTERIAYSIAVPQHRKGNRHGHGPDAGSAAEALRERAEAFLRTYDFHHRLSIGEMARQLGCSAQKLGYLMPNLRYRLVEQYVHAACEPFKKDTERNGSSPLSVPKIT